MDRDLDPCATSSTSWTANGSSGTSAPARSSPRCGRSAARRSRNTCGGRVTFRPAAPMTPHSPHHPHPHPIRVSQWSCAPPTTTLDGEDQPIAPTHQHPPRSPRPVACATVRGPRLSHLHRHRAREDTL